MDQILKALGIEWQALFVQIVAFAILYLLLRRFLFGPVAKILKSRADEVTAHLDQAQVAKDDADRIREELEHRLAAIHEEARQKVQQGVQEGRAAREQIIEDARREAEQFINRGRQQLDHDRSIAYAQLRDRVVDLAIEAASRAIRETLDEDRARRTIDHFISSLEASS